MLPNYKLIKRGKVRDIYQGDDEKEIFIIATDSISAFDKKLNIEIPDKGKILTSISAFWTMILEDEGILTSYLSSNTPVWRSDYPALIEPDFSTTQLFGRVTKMMNLDMFPVECIVRGHISGSAWKLYEQGQRKICGVELPEGLKNGSKLPEPIFTPTTKAPEGEHDENITLEEMSEILWKHELGRYDTAVEIRRLCIGAYKIAYDYALARGLILADTKFELGVDKCTYGIFVGDEILTPDSSRYWDAESFVPGLAQQSFDKQIIRDYLAEAKKRGEKDIHIPAEVLERTRQRYIELYNRLTGETWNR